ncbi:hypothetical protein [Coleofasciculus sp. F4-SAH-05]|uniref:hypothetical protein n=1 Tax=Coleofasciculus sp. F4-SAH-05 TaxID=3069525 RepID=UPI0032FD765E
MGNINLNGENRHWSLVIGHWSGFEVYLQNLIVLGLFPPTDLSRKPEYWGMSMLPDASKARLMSLHGSIIHA